MKIFLAGGNGYVGSRLSRALLASGYEVHICDLNWFGDHAPLAATSSQKDLFDVTFKELEGFDQVIFLAGFSNDPMAECKPSLNFKYNAALPAYLCYEAKRAKVKRFIYASSCSVYGFAWDKMYTEEDTLKCSYPYGISKYQGEVGCLEQVTDNFSVISLRKGTISGYSPRMRLDLVVNAMVNSAIKKGQITVNNPSLWRPILSLGDAVSAYVRSVQAPMHISGAFNVASLNTTVGQIGESVYSSLIASDFDPKLIVLDKEDMRNYKVSTKKAQEVLGFLPSGSVQSIVNDLLVHQDKWEIETDFYYNARICERIL